MRSTSDIHVDLLYQDVHAKLLKCPLPKRASTATLKSTWSLWIFSLVGSVLEDARGTNYLFVRLFFSFVLSFSLFLFLFLFSFLFLSLFFASFFF